ncbi:homeobox protein 3 [Solanum tuberosum]|nr:PREDICTED: homeobox protein 3 [Solanum tuberosum]
MDFSLPLVTNMSFIKEEMPSPLNNQILNFCESELFSEIQNSDVASSSNGCCYDEQSSYSTTTATNFDLNKFQKNDEKNDGTITKTATSTTNVSPDNNNNNNININNTNDNMSMIFDTQDEIDNDISASIDFTPSANFTLPDHHFLQQHEEQFDVNCSVIPLSHQYHHHPPPLGHIYEDESLSSLPPYMRGLASTSSCAFLDPNMMNYLQGNINNTMNSETSALFAAAANSHALFFGSQLPNQELDFQGENGRIFCPDSLSRIYNNEIQALSNESQHLVSGGGCSNTLATEITSFEDPTFKSGRCSVEERRKKIHRYMKKRNERNFSKRIKYACRKTLADSRPRVRGRFARNDEFGEASKANSCGTIEEDTISHEDVRLNNIMYHPNMVTSSTHLDNNATIFTTNCHVPTTNGPYDMCTPLYCTDGQMH